MPDHRGAGTNWTDPNGESPEPTPDLSGHAFVRDALPALLHGRLAPGERARVQAHLTGCAPCRTELALLTLVRDAHREAAPALSLERIAAGVRARTLRSVDGTQRPAPNRELRTRRAAPRMRMVRSARPPSRARASSLRWSPAWSGGAARAVAAAALLAVGAGAWWAEHGGSTPAALPRTGAPSSAGVQLATTGGSGVEGPAPTTVAAAGDGDSSLLGASFSDLSDRDLAAVVAAVDAAVASPDDEPAPVDPTPLSARGG